MYLWCGLWYISHCWDDLKEIDIKHMELKWIFFCLQTVKWLGKMNSDSIGLELGWEGSNES